MSEDKKTTLFEQAKSIPTKEILRSLQAEGIDWVDVLLHKIAEKQPKPALPKKWLIIASSISAFFIVILVVVLLWVSSTLNTINKTCDQQVSQILLTKNTIELVNSWERLPPGERKERLRSQFYSIIRYYTNETPVTEKLDDNQILQTFNQLWVNTERLNTVNFFLPIAYMKATTNFNPYYNKNGRQGIAFFQQKNAEAASNLPLIRSDPTFSLEFKGSGTLLSSIDSVKLLVAKIDDLSHTFNGREDWILFALLTDDFNVINNYWDNGNGKIPDELYAKGTLADCLSCYYYFKNWDIPKKD